MLLYYITDRAQLARDETQRRVRLLDKISEAAQAGVDYIQLREKDLPAREFELLARQAAQLVRASGSKTRLLINSRTDIALAVQADGVHLRSNDISPADVRMILKRASPASQPLIAVSSHNLAEVVGAKNAGADFVVFGPVFGKRDLKGNPTGTDQLRNACGKGIPVFSLGGLTTNNVSLCVEAGASGIAAIRLFQENEIAKVVEMLGGDSLVDGF
ncbi:MAG TPA: thiamine phosphate synthase [Terriglobales bacterium]|nr:thiamine phosphate synthase [Terriglobales bacterium]